MAQTVFANGVNIFSHSLPHSHSCAVGLWLENGVRHQLPGQDGLAHLLEHVLLRDDGLQTRFEAMGGQINAETGRELTSFYGLVPATQACELVELFFDCLCGLRLNPAELDAEKRLIVQEQREFGITLEEHAFSKAWPGDAFAWPILGSSGSLADIDLLALQRYLRAVRVGRRLAVVAVGNIQHERLLDACNRAGEFAAGERPLCTPPRFHGTNQALRSDSGSQTQLLWLLPAPAAKDSDYAAILIANHILAGGTSSRLYRELREREGWVYLLNGQLAFYSDLSVWMVRLACASEVAERCIAKVANIVERLCDDGPTAAELDLAKQHLAARLLLADDDPASRMQRLAREHFYLGRQPDVEEYLAMLARVTAENVRAVVADCWSQAIASGKT